MALVLNNLTYTYYHKQSSDRVYLVLHGSGPAGVESPFISNVIQALTKTGQSVFGLNFPYCERGEENASGAELLEEVEAIRLALLWLQGRGYNVTIVAKSLGAIAASFYLERYPDERINLIVLGYVIGDVKTMAIKNNLRLVIQGENDRFGGLNALTDELSDVACEVSIIEKADHSYRNDEKQPVYQEVALATLLDMLGETK
jgi:predicted alpha/beta-hydrolase family hydrolase